MASLTLRAASSAARSRNLDLRIIRLAGRQRFAVRLGVVIAFTYLDILRRSLFPPGYITLGIHRIRQHLPTRDLNDLVAVDHEHTVAVLSYHHERVHIRFDNRQMKCDDTIATISSRINEGVADDGVVIVRYAMPCEHITFTCSRRITGSYRQFRQADIRDTVTQIESTCINNRIQRVLIVRITFPSIGLTEGIEEGVTNGIHIERIDRTTTRERSRVLEVDTLRCQRRGRYCSIISTIGTVLPRDIRHGLQRIVMIGRILCIQPSGNTAQVKYLTSLDRQLRSEVI